MVFGNRPQESRVPTDAGVQEQGQSPSGCGPGHREKNPGQGARGFSEVGRG